MTPSEDPGPERRRASAGRPALEIHRSPRRWRSAAARIDGEVVVLRLPAGMDPVDEERVIERLVDQLSGRQRAEALGGDAGLASRADELADRYLDGVRATQVTWSGRMRQRHGSCTPEQGTIRISRSVASYPAFVRDYVLVHELAHLQVPDHSAAFHALLDRYPHAARARGFLEGYEAGRLAAAIPPVEGDDRAQPAG